MPSVFKKEIIEKLVPPCLLGDHMKKLFLALSCLAICFPSITFSQDQPLEATLDPLVLKLHVVRQELSGLESKLMEIALIIVGGDMEKQENAPPGSLEEHDSIMVARRGVGKITRQMMTVEEKFDILKMVKEEWRIEFVDKMFELDALFLTRGVKSNFELVKAGKMGIKNRVAHDSWLWNCGSWFSHSVKDTVTWCSLICGTNFYFFVSSLGRKKDETEWRNLVNSYRILPIPSYRVYGEEELEKAISAIPESALPIWKNLTKEHFRLWIADWEERTQDQKLIKVDLSLSFQERFDLYVSRLNHPTHFKAYRKYFGNKLTDEEALEFEGLSKGTSLATREKIVRVLRGSKSPFWKRLSKKVETDELSQTFHS